MISITAIGDGLEGKIVYRNGAKVGDLICVTGDLGGAYLGLQILMREKQVYLADPNMKPEINEDNTYLIQRILKPEAQKKTIEFFKLNDILPTSMIDISDGLASDLYQLATASQVGFTVYEDKLPIDPQTYQRAIDLGIDPTIAVLNGGEDYELMFTIPQSAYETMKKEFDFTIIGHAVAKSEGMHLISKSNINHKIMAQGWEGL